MKLMLNGIAKMMMRFDAASMTALRATLRLFQVTVSHCIVDSILGQTFLPRRTESVIFCPSRSFKFSIGGLLPLAIDRFVGRGSIVCRATQLAFISMSKIPILLFVEFIQRLNDLAYSAFSNSNHGHNYTIRHGICVR